jgi:hypothetical protein
LRQVGGLFPGTPVSSINKTDHHDIIKILLKVALNAINKPTQRKQLLNFQYEIDDKHALLCFLEKMLKIPKSQQEDVNRRTTDNDQKKKGKRANNDLHNITRITKI